ncbi:MAG: ion transporter [Ginsengibacter sp.]
MTTREKLHTIVFGTTTKAGKQFDVVLLWVILISVVAVMLESVPEFGSRYIHLFFVVEWSLTILFTIEYLVRIWISPRPLKYLLSFWGIIDFLSIVPTYLSLFIIGYNYFIVVRVFRLLRVFRIMKLARFNSEAGVLLGALRSSFHKISIFLLSVVSIVVFLGTLMYVVEGGKEGFTSIPQSIYWAIVTVTTVGYGDMVPHTVLGKFISSIAMIIGYAIIAVPTGIITVEMSRSASKTLVCDHCNHNNDASALFCNKCGYALKGE